MELEQFTVYDFEYHARRKNRVPLVSIYKDKSLRLSRAAWEGLGSPATVHLLYARAEKVVGIRPAPENDLKGVRIKESRGNYMVAGTNLAIKCATYRWSCDGRKTRSCERSGDPGTL